MGVFGLIGKGVFGTGIGRTAVGGIAGGAIGAATSDNKQTSFFEDVARGAAIGAGIGLATTKTARLLGKAAGRQALRTPLQLKGFAAARAEGAGILEAASFGKFVGRGGAPTFSQRLKMSYKAGREIGAGRLESASSALHAARRTGHAAYKGEAAKAWAGAAWSGAKAVGSAGFRAANWMITNPGKTAAIGAGGLGMYALASSGARPSQLTMEQRAQAAQAMGGPSTGFGLGTGVETRQAFMASTDGLVQGLHSGRHR